MELPSKVDHFEFGISGEEGCAPEDASGGRNGGFGRES
jgi:hypothetical protein